MSSTGDERVPGTGGEVRLTESDKGWLLRAQEQVAADIVAHVARSTHGAQLAFSCMVLGAIDALIAFYIFSHRIMLPMHAISGARIGWLVWAIVALLILASVGCLIMWLVQPPTTIRGVARFNRIRLWMLLSSIALISFALVKF